MYWTVFNKPNRVVFLHICTALLVVWLLLQEFVCIDDYDQNIIKCRPKCTHGKFGLFGMATCCYWLTCSEIGRIQIIKEIGQGAVKQVFLGRWYGYDVAVYKLQSFEYIEDFQHGLRILALLQPSSLVTQLVGWCDKQHSFVTEYHQHRSADLLLGLLSFNRNLRKFNSPRLRFRLCINYVEILVLLHGGSSAGVRVMCDSNDLQKLLQQFLVTGDLHLIVNDLDALPEVTPMSKVKCGHWEIVSDFAAPEQHWPFDGADFDDAHMPGYDEKTDIWKVPDVCLHFLGNCSDCHFIRNRLFKIHNSCKENDPTVRPSARELLTEYKNVWKLASF